MNWFTEHYIEIFGAITGIIYVFLEIKQNIWLWPLGIVTSAVYIYVFYNTGFYADMGLQWYYLFISIYGWIVWAKGRGHGAGSKECEERGKNGEEANGDRQSVEDNKFRIINVRQKQALWLVLITVVLFAGIWFVLASFTDSTIPGWDAFTTALSITATWMLARKIIEHWYLWMIVNVVSIGLYIYKGLYPTVVLFLVYGVMAIIGYLEWRKEIGWKE